MRKWPIKSGDPRKLAFRDTVHSILESKGERLVWISPDALVYDAIAKMAQEEVGALLVVWENRLVGILSERDYARKVILQGRSSKEMRVGEIMTFDPISVSPDETVDDCMRIMSNHGIRHLPVVEREVLQGMISVGDVLEAVIAAQAFTIDELFTYIETDYPS